MSRAVTYHAREQARTPKALVNVASLSFANMSVTASQINDNSILDQLVQVNNNDNIKFMHYWSFEWGIHQ